MAMPFIAFPSCPVCFNPPPCSSQVWPVTEIVTYGFDPADAPLDMRGEDGGGAWWGEGKGGDLKNREGMIQMTYKL